MSVQVGLTLASSSQPRLSVMRKLNEANNIKGETMQYMYEEDWAEFNKKFPSAASFICERTLRNELHSLRVGKEFGGLTFWQSNRLSGLEYWEQAVNEIKGVKWGQDA